MALDEKQRQCIEHLYDEMYDRLRAYALSQLDDGSLAEEAVQDTFRIASYRAKKLLSSPNPQGWLTITLKNVIANMKLMRARLSKVVVASLDADKSMPYAVTDETDVDFIYGDLISREDYDLLKRIVFEKQTMPEAASELGISIEACKKRVQRAKKNLREILKEK